MDDRIVYGSQGQQTFSVKGQLINIFRPHTVSTAYVYYIHIYSHLQKFKTHSQLGDPAEKQAMDRIKCVGSGLLTPGTVNKLQWNYWNS